MDAVGYSLSLNEAVIESIDNGIIVVGRDGTILKTNRKFTEMWRMPSDIPALKRYNVVLSYLLNQLNEPDEFLALVSKLDKEPEAESFDLLFLKDERVFERTSKPLFSEGKVAGRIWSFSDITARRRAEEALRESEMNLSITLNSIGDAVIATDADGLITRMNPVAERLTGWTLAEAYGKPLTQIFYIVNSMTRVPAANPVEHVITTGSTVGLANHTALIDRNGLEHQIADSAAPIFSPQGAIMGVVLVFRDVTEEYRIRAELEESENRYRSLFENNHEAMLLINPETGEIVDANPAACKYYGWTRDELRHKLISQINTLPPDQIHAEMQLATAQQRNHFNFQHRRADNSIRDVEVFSGPITAQGRPLLYSIVHDVTARKLAEKALQESEGRVRAKLDAILLPEGDIGSLQLEDIIDTQAIQDLMDDFFKLTHIGVAFIDLQGKVLVATGWQDICVKYHRVNAETVKHCIESDTLLSKDLESGTYRMYLCKNNMRDISTPIIIGEKHIGNLFLGQFFFDDELLDYGLFREQARRYGFNEEEYIAAFERVPRWSREKVDIAIKFYMKLADMISKLSYSNIKLARTLTERNRSEAKVQESKEQLSRIIEVTRVGTWELDIETGELTVNQRWAGIFGYTREELTSVSLETWRNHIHPDQISIFDIHLQKHITGELPYLDTEYQLRSQNGQWVWVNSRCQVTRWTNDGKPLRLSGIITDITERKTAEQKAAMQHERLMLSLEASGDNVFDWDVPAERVHFSRTAGEMYDHLTANPDTSYRSMLNSIHPEDLPRVRALHELAYNTDSFQIEARKLSKDGTWRWVLTRYKVVERSTTGAPIRVIGVDTDITDRKLKEEELIFLSTHDKLTGLYNRRHIEQYLKSESAGKQVPTTLIMGDVNGLKLINDTFGHEEGDKLLISISNIIKDAVGDNGTVVRWGGDEFLIVLPGIHTSEAAKLADQIRTACSSSHKGAFPLSVALGVATRHTPDQSIEAIMSEAEERMYHNKLMEGKSARSAIISALRETLSSKTFETEEHCMRMQTIAINVAKRMALSDSQRDDLMLLALLHDIGKIGVPEAILAKPDKLTPAERQAIEKHTEIGFRIAKASYELSHIANGILSHHEWWNGAGYPQGLSGEAIPLISRIIAVIDAFDAMTSDRPYRRALTRSQAFTELKSCSGTQFDPQIIDVVLATLNES